MYLFFFNKRLIRYAIIAKIASPAIEPLLIIEPINPKKILPIIKYLFKSLFLLSSGFFNNKITKIRKNIAVILSPQFTQNPVNHTLLSLQALPCSGRLPLTIQFVLPD